MVHLWIIKLNLDIIMTLDNLNEQLLNIINHKINETNGWKLTKTPSSTYFKLLNYTKSHNSHTSLSWPLGCVLLVNEGFDE
jgi:hypothetical protein